MNFLRRNPDLKSISALIRLYSLARKSHYDVLKLGRNCTDKEIKEAFIKLSKEYHPDKNKDSKAQEKFVRILEAYNVLSKPSSRAAYDSTSEIETWTPPYGYRPPPSNMGNYSQSDSDEEQRSTNNSQSQYNYYYNTDNQSSQSESHQKHYNKDYYGVPGLKKLPNLAIIAACFGFAIVGLIVQMFVIRESFTIHRKEINARSKRLAEEYEKVRDTAASNGNEMQTRILLEKIVSAANPSVATASLGTALANEKKEEIANMATEVSGQGVPEVTDERNTMEELKVTYELLRKLFTYFS